MTAFGGRRNIQFGSQTSSDEFLFAGARYAWSPELSTSYFYGGLDGIYKAQLRPGSCPAARRQAELQDRPALRAPDRRRRQRRRRCLRRHVHLLGGHAFGAGYQQLNGDTGFAYIAGSDNSLVNLVQINDFGNEDERSWQVRYDYDFAAMGIPGLSLMTRYLSGDNVDRGPGASEGKTWERNTDLAYVFQRPAEEPRPAPAQRHHPQQLRQRSGREPLYRQLQPATLVSTTPQHLSSLDFAGPRARLSGHEKATRAACFTPRLPAGCASYYAAESRSPARRYTPALPRRSACAAHRASHPH